MKKFSWLVVLLIGVALLCGVKTPYGEVNIGDVVRLVSGAIMTVTGFVGGIVKGKIKGGGRVEISKASIKGIISKK